MLEHIENFRKAFVENISKSYSNDLEKGGKRAVIGEIREWSGKKVVKHAEGWVEVNDKSGKHLLHTSDGKSQPAELHHVEHAKKSLGGVSTKETPVDSKQKDSRSIEKLESDIKMIADSKINNVEKDKKLVGLEKLYRQAGGKKTMNEIVEGKSSEKIEHETELGNKYDEIHAQVMEVLPKHIYGKDLEHNAHGVIKNILDKKVTSGLAYNIVSRELIKIRNEQRNTPEKRNLLSLNETKDDFEKIDEKVKSLYTENHKNHKVVEKTYNDFVSSSKTLIDKNKDVDFNFDFSISWYDKQTKGSLGGYVSIDKKDIVSLYQEEYDAQKKQYPNGFRPEQFVAEKIVEICNSSGVKTWGSGSNYSTSGNKVYVKINNGEVN